MLLKLSIVSISLVLTQNVCHNGLHPEIGLYTNLVVLPIPSAFSYEIDKYLTLTRHDIEMYLNSSLLMNLYISFQFAFKTALQ